MNNERFKQEYPVGSLIKYTEILYPKTIQEQIWNSTAKQGIVFRIEGHLGEVIGGIEKVFRVLGTVYDYDQNTCSLSNDFLEDEHILLIGDSKLSYISIVNKTNNSTTNINDRYPNICPHCGAPAYIGMFSVDCSKSCC